MSSQNRDYPPGYDIFGAPWPEDPRLQEQQTLGEPDTGSGPEAGEALPLSPGVAAAGVKSAPDGLPSPSGPDYEPVRSSVKVIKNTKGAGWEVRVMAGDPEALIDSARLLAVKAYRALEAELG